MKSTGLIINGKFIECDITNINIEIQGEINNLSLNNGDLGSNSIVIGSGIQIINGNVKSGISNVITNSNISIHVTGNVHNINTSIGDIYCNEANTIESTSGDIKIDGNVSGNVESISGDITIKGNVKGNIRTISGDINN